MTPIVKCSVIDKKRQVSRSFNINICSPRMVHDFAITTNFIVIADLPLEIRGDFAVKNSKSIFVFDKTARTRYGLIPRYKENVAPIWFDFDPFDAHYAFHFSNAYETEENEQTVVVVHCCAWKDVAFFDFETEHPFYFSDDHITLREIKLNLDTGKYTMKVLLPDMNAEFPVINPQFIGRQNRYIYVASQEPKAVISAKAKESVMFTGFVKYDLQEKKIAKHVSYGEERQAGEVVFHPRENAQSEDDGYLMTFVYDPQTEKSEFCLWEATDCSLVLKFNT